MLVYLNRNGPPEALNCPVFMCDQCLNPISGREGGDGYGGIIIWRARPDGTQEAATVHKGRCNRSYEASHPGERWLWNDLDKMLAQLTHNTLNAFELEDNVEYVAPMPSRWRLGEYRRPNRDLF